ncbi:RDD family protein [Camelliibacillus cellulosilyticus]|uniref:RDD family protein n=1 Tax=Camelliibacillus cellulosilyticus TaxID=2174486 RepID=A0ABV9GRA0_9BACL
MIKKKEINKSLVAPFLTRIYAFLLDYLVIVIYGVVVVGGLSIALRPFITPLFSHSPAVAELTGFILLTLPVTLYFALCEQSRWQGTWGKRRMSIHVINGSGERIGFGRAFLRSAVKFLPWELAHFAIWHFMLPNSLSQSIIIAALIASYVLPVLYLVFPFTNQKRKTVYDWIAGTEVIRLQTMASSQFHDQKQMPSVE